jgi:hypothetical protein
MKIKSLTEIEFKRTFQSDQQLTFYKTSPFSQIKDPDGLIFFTVHWDESTMIQGATGTAYACRVGTEASHLLKFDLYRLRSTTIINIEKEEIGYHHADKLPSFIEKQAKAQKQNWVIDDTSEILKKFSQLK